MLWNYDSSPFLLFSFTQQPNSAKQNPTKKKKKRKSHLFHPSVSHNISKNNQSTYRSLSLSLFSRSYRPEPGGEKKKGEKSRKQN
jgi:hypothetical protein